MHVYSNVLEMIGHTPMVKVQNLDTGPCELFLKLENMNPGGSIKDRIGLTMIEAAEQDGRLKPGQTILEATAGNTGLGLALVAALKGYPITIVLTEKISAEKVGHLKALGAEVIVTRADVLKGHPEHYQDLAERMAAEDAGYFYVDQFSNAANVTAHEQGTAPEIWEQMAHKLDALICGVGSGGTLTGCGRFFKEVNPEMDIIVADPQGSVVANVINHAAARPVAPWIVEGVGSDIIQTVCEPEYATRAVTIEDAHALQTVHDVLRHEGLLVGTSTGTLIAAALDYCRAQTEAKRVVTFCCDTGNKYLSKAFNETWLAEHGFKKILKKDLGEMAES